MKHVKTWEIFEAEYDVFSNKAGEDFWGDTGAGILPICRTTGRLLVAYRSEYVNEPHTWGIVGGKLDDGEKDVEDAAKRELQEELGYDGKFELVPAYVFKSKGGGFEYHNFIGIVEEEFEPTFDWETEKAEWMTLDQLMKLKPKHFGLETLIKESGDIIKKYAR